MSKTPRTDRKTFITDRPVNDTEYELVEVVHSYFARELERDLNEQCRLLGMSSEREARLLARIAEVERENARLREDVIRLDWMRAHVSGKEFRRIGICMDNTGDMDELRQRIDDILSNAEQGIRAGE